MFIIFGISAYNWLEISEIVVDAIIVHIKVLKLFFFLIYSFNKDIKRKLF